MVLRAYKQMEWFSERSSHNKIYLKALGEECGWLRFPEDLQVQQQQRSKISLWLFPQLWSDFVGQLPTPKALVPTTGGMEVPALLLESLINQRALALEQECKGEGKLCWSQLSGMPAIRQGLCT